MKNRKLKPIRFDPRIKKGYFTDVYFNRTKSILEKDNYHPILKMQVFQKNNDACLCGINEAIEILKQALGKNFKKLEVMALQDGDIVNAWETIMTISGDYSLFAHLETVYLGALARGTKVATNVYRCSKATEQLNKDYSLYGKPILFFPARFDTYVTQSRDGYAYNVGRKKSTGGVSTDAQGELLGIKGLGTIPHGLIAAYSGDTVKAALKFAKYTDPKVNRIVLVDFDNDCVDTTLKVADAMWEKYKITQDKRYKLFGVRLDTSGNMVDKSIKKDMDRGTYLGSAKPTGVTPRLVMNVHNALTNRINSIYISDLERDFYKDIKIIVSGGFAPEKIAQFEKLQLPVFAYGVGSSLLQGNFDFTADIVQKQLAANWNHNAKIGRTHYSNPKLKKVK